LLALAVAVGALAAGGASIIVGLPSLRLRGDYLAIATMGFGEIVYNLFLVHLQNRFADTAYYMPSSLDYLSRTVNFASSWIVALLAIVVVRNMLRSTAGRGLMAIREDEIAAGAVGIRTTRSKLLAFVVGSMFAGAAGVLEAHQTATVNPASYRFDRSIEMIVPVVLGGSGSLTGCVLASAAFTYLLERLRDLPTGAQQFRTIVYAGVLVLIMILRPQGLMGRMELGDLWARFRRRRDKQQEPAQEAMPPPPIAAPICCTNLTIRFGGLTAVRDFNLELVPPEIVGLIGPNGAGKTTCFNLITGIYRPTSGDIRLGDRSIRNCGCAEINRRGVARTFQNIRLFAELTVLENVRVALHSHLRTGFPAAVFRTPAYYGEEEQTRVWAWDLLRTFDLTQQARELARNLPYGLQRRLEIARAMATQPGVLCLDEPAAGMNPSEKVDLMSLIRRLRERYQIGVLLIEHDMKVVMNICDRILVLDYGETIAEGRPEAIRDNPKVIAAYLGEPNEQSR
jgi:ABC-type branched-subunit amino acid transport system ATPase component/ABC-type branched-subunit amino acid transport system permease subunit